jgi:hypothetical protein
MTVAELGFKINSQPLKEGLLNLEKLVPAAQKVETSTVKMSSEATKAFKAIGTGSQALDAMTRNLDRTEKGLKSVGVAGTTAGAALRNVAPPLVEFGKIAPAVDSATEALKRNTRAAQENRAAQRMGSMNTANMAAQFQDIGVTTAMGMSPMMIALQQGTQLSAVLGNQGLRGTVGALGAAFASILSPVSLLTIATIGLGTAGVQALMGMMNSTDQASKALERHQTWLDKILQGYDSAREAADEAAGAALRLPQEAVQSNLSTELVTKQAAFTSELEETAKAQRELNEYTERWIEQRAESARRFPDDERALGRFDQLITVAKDLTDIEITAQSTTAQINQFITRATELYNAAKDPAVKQQASDMMAFGEQLKQAQSGVQGVTAAIAEMKAQSPINIAVNVATDQAAAAIQELINMRPELRTPGQVAREEAATRLSAGRSAPDAIIRQAAEENYAKTIAALDEVDRRAEAAKAARGAGKSFDRWGSATSQMEQRTAQARMEIDLLGKSTMEVERQRAEFELLNQARQAGVPITSDLNDQISRMASEYATATVELERQAEAQRLFAAEVDFYRGTLTNLFTGFAQGLREGENAWDSFADTATAALDRIADRAIANAPEGEFAPLQFGEAA